MTPKVTVLLPVYNGERFLEDSLKSVLSQSFTDFELVVVDDGSTDRTAGVLRKFAVADERLKIFSFDSNIGIVSALNFGISKSNAPLIARMDADDIIYPDRLKRQFDYFEDNSEVDLVGCLVEKFSSNGVRGGYKVYVEWLNGLCDHESIVKDIFVESPIAHPSVMMRKRAVLSVGGYEDHGWAEDYDLWLRLYLAGGKFGKVERVLLRWRDDPNRLSRSDHRYSLDNFYRCKAHYMAENILKDRSVVIWGSKRRSRRFADYLGARIKAYVDLDKKSIGNKIKSIPVIAPQDLKKYPKSVVLSYVSTREARSKIREWLISNGYTEMKDFFMMA